jgi:hypothetical protein
MTGDMMSHAHLIEAWGGVTTLAKAIDVDPKRAIHWPRRGIPAKYWHLVEEASKGKPYAITAVQLQRIPAQIEQRSAA